MAGIAFKTEFLTDYRFYWWKEHLRDLYFHLRYRTKWLEHATALSMRATNVAERDKIWGWEGARVIWVRTGVASTGWWATCHTKPEALNAFFDKVTKVWMIYLKSERDRISNTRFFLFFCKWGFVDVSSLCRPFSYFFFLYFFLTFFSWLNT